MSMTVEASLISKLQGYVEHPKTHQKYQILEIADGQNLSEIEMAARAELDAIEEMFVWFADDREASCVLMTDKSESREKHLGDIEKLDNEVEGLALRYRAIKQILGSEEDPAQGTILAAKKASLRS